MSEVFVNLLTRRLTLGYVVLTLAHPASAEGIEKYLASGAVRSIGPKTARSIVSVYGDRTLEIVEKFPTVLLDIKGIGPKKLKRITQSWTEQKEVRKIIAGSAEKSYGIQVARLAGLPDTVLQRAREKRRRSGVTHAVQREAPGTSPKSFRMLSSSAGSCAGVPR